MRAVLDAGAEAVGRTKSNELDSRSVDALKAISLSSLESLILPINTRIN